MTKSEWLDIGYEKNIIDMEEYEEYTFSEAYKEWSLMKINCIKPQSFDRIEVTYQRHYANTDFVEKCISKISEEDIINFLTRIIKAEPISLKEFGRVLQIVRGVLVYFKDIKKGGAILYDWEKIKRYVPMNALDITVKKEFAVSKSDIEKMLLVQFLTLLVIQRLVQRKITTFLVTRITIPN